MTARVSEYSVGEVHQPGPTDHHREISRKEDEEARDTMAEFGAEVSQYTQWGPLTVKKHPATSHIHTLTHITTHCKHRSHISATETKFTHLTHTATDPTQRTPCPFRSTHSDCFYRSPSPHSLRSLSPPSLCQPSHKQKEGSLQTQQVSPAASDTSHFYSSPTHTLPHLTPHCTHTLSL